MNRLSVKPEWGASQRSGFVLIEVILAGAALLLVTGSLVLLVVQTGRSFERERTLDRARASARSLLGTWRWSHESGRLRLTLANMDSVDDEVQAQDRVIELERGAGAVEWSWGGTSGSWVVWGTHHGLEFIRASGEIAGRRWSETLYVDLDDTLVRIESHP